MLIKNKWFQDKLDDKYGEGKFIIIGEYTKTHDPIEFKHLECNTIFTKKPSYMMSSFGGCSKCNPKDRLKTTNEFINEIKKLPNGNEYEVLSEYKGNKKYINMKHLKCNHVYKVRPVNFIIGRRCPKCNNRIKKDSKMIQSELDSIYGNNVYKIIDKYTNNKDKIRFEHIECGTIFKSSTHNLLRKKSKCPNCNSSIPESLVSKFLDEFIEKNKLNWNVLRENTFEGCYNKHLLPFDFTIYDENNEIITIIEYDGRQHFIPVFGEDSYNSTRNNDIIKNKFCERENIPLIRLNYTDKKYIKTLEAYLNEIVKNLNHDGKPYELKGSRTV